MRHMRGGASAIVSSGIDVYELRPDAASCAALVTIDGGCSLQRIFGLHAKSFVFDADDVVCRFDEPEHALRVSQRRVGVDHRQSGTRGAVAGAITLNMRPQNSWHVTLGQDGDLSGRRSVTAQPKRCVTNPRRRGGAGRESGFIAMLPLEKYL